MTRQTRAFLDKTHTVCAARGFAKVKTISVLCKKLLNELASGVESSFQLGCSQVVNHMVLKLLETDTCAYSAFTGAASIKVVLGRGWDLRNDADRCSTKRRGGQLHTQRAFAQSQRTQHCYIG